MASGDGDLDGTVAWGDLLTETVGRLVAGGFSADDATREARWIVEDYANDLREFIRKLREKMN